MSQELKLSGIEKAARSAALAVNRQLSTVNGEANGGAQ
jgi:hypothetical protein